jgi:hypothetical protein
MRQKNNIVIFCLPYNVLHLISHVMMISLLSFLEPYSCRPHTKGKDNRFTYITVLHLATLCRNMGAVQYLLACGALQRRICKEGKFNFNLPQPKENTFLTGNIGKASDNDEDVDNNRSMDVDDDNQSKKSYETYEYLKIIPWSLQNRVYNHKYSIEHVTSIKLQIKELLYRIKSEVKSKLIEKKTLQTTNDDDDDDELSGLDGADESNIDEYLKSKLLLDISFIDEATLLFTEYFDKLDVKIEREAFKND